jgi:hypothetical protein
MPRDRTIENKVLDETAIFLENILSKFKELEKEGKIRTKDYIGLLPPRKKLLRIRQIINKQLDYVDFGVMSARNNKLLKEIKSGKIKFLPLKPASREEWLKEEFNHYAGTHRGRY